MKKTCLLMICIFCMCSQMNAQYTPHEMVESRVTVEGKTYIKISLAELYKIIDSKDETRLKLDYVVRGIVYQNKDLRKQNVFGLTRIFMYCCISDAMAVGLKVTPASSVNVIPNKWVDVYGHLENTQLQSAFGENTDTTGMGIPNAIPKDWIIVADKIKSTNPPYQPYMNTINTKEPYYY